MAVKLQNTTREDSSIIAEQKKQPSIVQVRALKIISN